MLFAVVVCCVLFVVRFSMFVAVCCLLSGNVVDRRNWLLIVVGCSYVCADCCYVLSVACIVVLLDSAIRCVNLLMFVVCWCRRCSRLFAAAYFFVGCCLDLVVLCCLLAFWCCLMLLLVLLCVALSLLIVAWCVLLLCVVYCLLFDLCRMFVVSFVVCCCLLFVVCCLLFAVRCALFVGVSWLLRAVRRSCSGLLGVVG